MLVTKLDHLVVGAKDLASGVAYIKDTLGVDIPPGGEHKTLGTHNHVMQLGDDTFLEVVARSPTLPPPGRPRWFGLDDPYVIAQLEQSPRLIAWVVNTNDLSLASESATSSIGQQVQLQRGDLRWTFSLPSDGRLLAHGLLPYVMQWHMQNHPARKMADTGCRLTGLEIRHPCAEWVESSLASLGIADQVSVVTQPAGSTPQLVATIKTPHGSCQLETFVGC